MKKQQLEKRIRDCENKLLKINNWEYSHLRYPENIKILLQTIIIVSEEKLFNLSLS